MPWVRRRNPHYSPVANVVRRLRRPARFAMMIFALLVVGWMLARTIDNMPSFQNTVAVE